MRKKEKKERIAVNKKETRPGQQVGIPWAGGDGHLSKGQHKKREDIDLGDDQGVHGFE